MTYLRRIAGKLKEWDDRRAGSTEEFDTHIAMCVDRAAARGRARQHPPLEEVVAKAWETGRTIDLSDVVYGATHSDNGQKSVAPPESYYYFLAGVVHSQHAQRIFEIGTRYGGSISAMTRGVVDVERAKIATVDIVDMQPGLKDGPHIKKIVGDANAEYVIKKTTAYFDAEPIDILFVDADHRFLPTITNVGLYITLLQPRLVLIDDIIISDSMRSMWNALKAAYGTEAINCVDVIPEIRHESCGFGLIRLR